MKDRNQEVILEEGEGANKRDCLRVLGVELGVAGHACTDITGFGILGHSLEMAKGSNVRINLLYNKLPFYPNALEMYRRGETTGSNRANRKLAEGFFKKNRELSREEEELLFDPQTSGGLLLSVPSTDADRLITELKRAGIEAVAEVGEVWQPPSHPSASSEGTCLA